MSIVIEKIMQDDPIEVIKFFLAVSIVFIAIFALLSTWWDVWYISKNHDKTTILLFGKDHDFATGAQKVRWVEASYVYNGGFIAALMFNKFPSRVTNWKKKANKRGHNPNQVAFYDTLLLNGNYKKIVELNPVLMRVVKIRLSLMVFIAIASVIVINL